MTAAAQLLELPVVILVGVDVARDNNSVGKLAAGQALLRALAIGDRSEFNEYLNTQDFSILRKNFYKGARKKHS